MRTVISITIFIPPKLFPRQQLDWSQNLIMCWAIFILQEVLVTQIAVF